MTNGQLVSRNYVTGTDYSQYEVDRGVYDKDWFPYTLLHKPQIDTDIQPRTSISQNFNYYQYKALQIDH